MKICDEVICFLYPADHVGLKKSVWRSADGTLISDQSTTKEQRTQVVESDRASHVVVGYVRPNAACFERKIKGWRQ